MSQLININKLVDALNVLYYAKIFSLNNRDIDHKMAKLFTDLKKFKYKFLIWQSE